MASSRSNLALAAHLDLIANEFKKRGEAKGIGFTRSAQAVRQSNVEFSTASRVTLLGIKFIGEKTLEIIEQFLSKGTSDKLEKLLSDNTTPINPTLYTIDSFSK